MVSELKNAVSSDGCSHSSLHSSLSLSLVKGKSSRLPLIIHPVISCAHDRHSDKPVYFLNFGVSFPNVPLTLRTILGPAIFLLIHNTFFKTAVCFYTFDNLSLLGEEHEDDRDTRCMVCELKEAVASDGSSHSLLHSSLSSSSKCKFSSLPIPHLLVHVPASFCHAPAIVVNMHDLGVCLPSSGSRDHVRNRHVHRCGTFRCLYFVFQIFHSPWLVLKTTTCSIVSRTDHQSRNPIQMPNTSSTCWAIVLSDSDSWSSKSASTYPVRAKHSGQHSFL